MSERGSLRGPLERGPERLFVKADPLRGRARLRHALRGGLGLPVPRLAEFANLEWLRAHGFHAPRPVLAGVIRRRWMPVFQFLYTEAIVGARTLREVFADGPAGLRTAAVELLAGEVVRLHAAGFVHRDLFPRNLLLTGTPPDLRIHFLDAWRGGPGPGLRGPAYDLGCLMLFAAELLPHEDQRRFFAIYLADRGEAARRALRRDVARERERLVAIHRRRPARTGGLPLPRTGWTPPL